MLKSTRIYKTLRQLKDYDRIIFNDYVNLHDYIIDNVAEKNEYISFELDKMFLREAVIQTSAYGNNTISYIYFNIKSEKELYIELYAFQKDLEEHRFDCILSASLIKESNEKATIELIDANDNLKLKDKREIIKFAQRTIIDVCIILKMVFDLKNNAKVVRKVIERKTKNVTAGNNTIKKTATDKPKRRKIYLKASETRYITLDLSEDRVKSFRKYQRHTGSWSVAAHIRHYKSGKVVNVKAYTKGEGKLKGKTYIV